MRLQDRVVIVTGGGVGIGRAYCLALAKEGANVVVADIQDNEAKKVAGEIEANGGEALAVTVDVTVAEKCIAMAEAALQKFGRIDVLVNNAAIYSVLKRNSFMDISGAEWDQVMTVNLRGLFFCVQSVYPAMKRQGKGKIINISSGTALNGTPFLLHYVTSKAGVLGFTRALARELGSDHITVNSITPGLTMATPEQNARLTPEQRESRNRRRCLQRDQYPDDLVGTVIFLSSDDSDFVTGQIINVDGGTNMH